MSIVAFAPPITPHNHPYPPYAIYNTTVNLLGIKYLIFVEILMLEKTRGTANLTKLVIEAFKEKAYLKKQSGYTLFIM